MSFKKELIYRYRDPLQYFKPIGIPLLKNGIIYWIMNTTCHAYDTRTERLLEPFEVLIEGHIVSINEEEIEILPRFDGSEEEGCRGVYTVSIRDKKIIKQHFIYGDNDLMVQLGTSYFVVLDQDKDIRFIPLSEHGKPFSIKNDKGYKFIDAFMDNGDLVTLWNKVYDYILYPDGMRCKGTTKASSSKFVSVFQGNIIFISERGIYINNDTLLNLQYSNPIWLVNNYALIDNCIYRIDSLPCTNCTMS